VSFQVLFPATNLRAKISTDRKIKKNSSFFFKKQDIKPKGQIMPMLSEVKIRLRKPTKINNLYQRSQIARTFVALNRKVIHAEPSEYKNSAGR
jgi:hypothetical protein